MFLFRPFFSRKAEPAVAQPTSSHQVLTMGQCDDFVEVLVRRLSYAEAAALAPNTRVVDPQCDLHKTVTDHEMGEYMGRRMKKRDEEPVEEEVVERIKEVGKKKLRTIRGY